MVEPRSVLTSIAVEGPVTGELYIYDWYDKNSSADRMNLRGMEWPEWSSFEFSLDSAERVRHKLYFFCRCSPYMMVTPSVSSLLNGFLAHYNRLNFHRPSYFSHRCSKQFVYVITCRCQMSQSFEKLPYRSLSYNSKRQHPRSSSSFLHILFFANTRRSGILPPKSKVEADLYLRLHMSFEAESSCC